MINITINQEFQPGRVEQVGIKNEIPGLRPGDFVVSEEVAKLIYTLLEQQTKQAA